MRLNESQCTKHNIMAVWRSFVYCYVKYFIALIASFVVYQLLLYLNVSEFSVQHFC